MCLFLLWRTMGATWVGLGRRPFSSRHQLQQSPPTLSRFTPFLLIYRPASLFLPPTSHHGIIIIILPRALRRCRSVVIPPICIGAVLRSQSRRGPRGSVEVCLTSPAHYSWLSSCLFSSRFILNLPDSELDSLERVCFQVEQALVSPSCRSGYDLTSPIL